MIKLLYGFLDCCIKGSFLGGCVKMALFLFAMLITMSVVSAIMHVVMYKVHKIFKR